MNGRQIHFIDDGNISFPQQCLVCFIDKEESDVTMTLLDCHCGWYLVNTKAKPMEPKYANTFLETEYANKFFKMVFK